MNTPFDWRDMLRFDKMIAPTFLTLLYYIVTVIVILGGLKLVFEGMDTPYFGSKMVTGGLALIVIGPFVVRLNFELLIVLFKIHTRLTSIDYSLRPHNSATQPDVSAPQPSPTAPFGSPAGPGVSPYPATYQAHDPLSQPRPVMHPGTEPTPQSPIGFQVPASEPMPGPALTTDEPFLQNFWSPGTELPPFTASPTQPVPPVELGSLLKKTPNWPAVLASIIVLYAVISPYAVLSYDAPAALGQLLGVTYTIKSGSLGIVIVLASLAMIGISAGGLKWAWFVGGYGVTLLGAVVAFLEDNSLFSQLAKVKANMAAIGSVGSALGQFMPEANQISGQMAQNVPGASQFLSASFYLFILAMAFLGYWALGGKYQERGLITGNNA